MFNQRSMLFLEFTKQNKQHWPLMDQDQFSGKIEKYSVICLVKGNSWVYYCQISCKLFRTIIPFPRQKRRFPAFRCLVFINIQGRAVIMLFLLGRVGVKRAYKSTIMVWKIYTKLENKNGYSTRFYAQQLSILYSLATDKPVLGIYAKPSINEALNREHWHLQSNNSFHLIQAHD